MMENTPEPLRDRKDIRERGQEVLQSVARLRGELSLQAHLFSLEMKQEWERLEKEWNHLERDLTPAKEEVAHGLRKAYRHLREHFKNAVSNRGE